MDTRFSQRAPTIVAAITFAFGAGVLAAPERMGRLIRLGDQPTTARIVGLTDLALVPGLLLAEARWAWMAARAALNLGVAARYLALAGEGDAVGRRSAAAVLVGLTVADAAVARHLYRTTESD